jgi:hypothetical protein
MTNSKHEGEYTENDPFEEKDTSTEVEGEYTDSEIPGQNAPDNK